MLLGECVQVTLGTGQQLLDGVKACLKTKPERTFAEGYTQDILVKSTKVNRAEKYTPVHSGRARRLPDLRQNHRYWILLLSRAGCAKLGNRNHRHRFD